MTRGQDNRRHILQVSNAVRTRYLPYLERALTRERLQHSLDVTTVMTDLVGVYPLDADQALTAAILHDVAKDLPERCLRGLAREAGLTFQHPAEMHPVYLHAPVSAYLARRDLGVTDEIVLGAIAAHSHVGQPRYVDIPLSWCLRFADVLAPTNPWPGEEKLRETVYQGRLHEGALLLTYWLIEWLEWHGIPVHPQISETRERLADAVPVGERFFDRA